jgi:predicted PurR-regulated permease PerM
MHFQYHARLTLGALRRWLIAQLYDSLIVACLWLAALVALKVPLAFVWAATAGALQFVPHFGPLLALFGPAMTMLLARAPTAHWLWFLAAYAAINLLDGLLLQPLLMRRQNRVPYWTSLFAPIVMGIIFPYWGVLLAPPLLAVIYAYRGERKEQASSQMQEFESTSEGIVLPPESKDGEEK